MKKEKKIGLFFGSFNPIHNGHLAIAEFFQSNTDLEEIWFVVSPQNPLKKETSLLPDPARLYMTQLAVQDKPYFKVCEIEFSLPKPSYTIDTLSFISNKFPQFQFVLIIGSDNLSIFNQWKDYQTILENWDIFVYNRSDFQDVILENETRITFFNAPLLDISSTMIREKIQQKEDISNFVPPLVLSYLKNHNFFL